MDRLLTYLFLFVLLILLTSSIKYTLAQNNEVQIGLKKSLLRIQVVSPTTVRITQTKNKSFSTRKSLSVLDIRQAPKEKNKLLIKIRRKQF
ncbi:MAG: hypothetical protein NTX65_02810 [Ignavibacteriales bacterium]|nr:hypothetical protein [Ignavibacteriales bacterium]